MRYSASEDMEADYEMPNQPRRKMTRRDLPAVFLIYGVIFATFALVGPFEANPTDLFRQALTKPKAAQSALPAPHLHRQSADLL